MALWASCALKHLKYHRTGRSNERCGGCAAKKSPFLPKQAEQAKKAKKRPKSVITQWATTVVVLEAVKDFAVKIMSEIHGDCETAGVAGTPHEAFGTILATLSPIAKDYTKPDNQFGTEMAKQLAWVRSKNATDVGMLGGNPVMNPAAMGMMPPVPPGFGMGGGGTPMEHAMLMQLSDMSKQRYGGTREEGVLIESFNVRGANRIAVPMALAMRSSIPDEVAGGRAMCDVKLRDTIMPGGIARKVELVAAVLYDKEFFPGEPQTALFMAGRWSRSDGFRPFMCQKMRGWAKRRSHAEDASMEVAAAGGTRGRAAIRNLPEFPPVTHMEPYESMVEGLLQLVEHAPIGIVHALREFFSIQQKHYEADARRVDVQGSAFETAENTHFTKQTAA